VTAEGFFQRQADLAHRRLGAGGVDRKRQQIAVAARAVGQRGQRRLDRGWIALGAQLGQPRNLVGADLSIVDLSVAMGSAVLVR